MASSKGPAPVAVEPQAPPAGRKFPCSKCGARLDFDPSSRALACPYCGHKEAIEPASGKVEERNWDEYWTNTSGEEVVLAGHANQVTCGGCGAVVLLDDKIVTDRCPYCGMQLENKPVAAEAMIAPEGLLPFKITNKQAVAAFNDWVTGRWFAPTTFRQFANLGRLNGVYVPFWTYDSMTYSYYTGERGDNYTETETYYEADANGQQVEKTRDVIKTMWTSVSGEVQHFFDDVLICASSSLPENLVNQLEPWDLPEVEVFKPDFLSGFQTERYGVGLKDGFEKARGIMDGHIRQLCIRDIGGDQQRVSTVQTQHVGVTFKHLLLPVWMAAYRYHDKSYRILVNARTGEVVGSRPYSVTKIVALVALIVALVLAVVLFFSSSRARGAEPERRPDVPTQVTRILENPQRTSYFHASRHRMAG